MMQKILCILLMLMFVMGCFSSLFGQESKPVDTVLFEDYIDKEFYLKKIINQSLVFYLDNHSFYYMNDERLYLYKDYQKVNIVSIISGGIRSKNKYYNSKSNKTKTGLLTLTYENDLLGKKSIILKSIDGKQILQKTFLDFIDKLLLTDTLSIDIPYYAMNTESGLIHNSSCNHIDSGSIYIYLHKIDSMSSPQYCSACFPFQMAINEFEADIFMGRVVADHYMSYNFLINDDKLQRKVDSLGRIILSNWPLLLRGFEYKFLIVDDSRIKAVACPGGIIILSTGMLESIDINEELLWVIAQEIAHVEFRHAIRQYKSSKRAAFWSSFIGTLTGVAMASQVDEINTKIALYDITSNMVNVFSKVILNGYSQKFEKEADILAEYFIRSYRGNNDNTNMVNYLNKLRYVANEIPKLDIWGNSGLSTHAKISERIYLSEFPISIPETPSKFYAYDKYENLVATFQIKGFKEYLSPRVPISPRELSGVKFEYIGNDENLTKLYKKTIYFCEISATKYMEKPSKISYFHFNNISGKFDNKEDIRLFPNSSVSLVFYHYPVEQFNFSDLLLLKLKLHNVKEWRTHP